MFHNENYLQDKTNREEHEEKLIEELMDKVQKV